MKLKFRKLQLARRGVQFFVLAFILAVPVAARYANYLSARELEKNLEKWDGSLQGESLAALDTLYRALPEGEKERAGRLRRNRDQVIAYAQEVQGGMWSAEIAGISMIDPLAGAECMAASKTAGKMLLIGLILPLAITLLLGRVFCSWICPVNLLLEFTDKLRRLLSFLELPPKDVKFSRGIKYTLLAVGLVMAAALAVPVLGYIYPPAIFGREAHDLVFGMFDRAEQGATGLWAGGLTWMSLFLLGIVVFEVAISRRWWCRYVCPGGGLYSLIGGWRIVRVKRCSEKCTLCGECTAVCPVGLKPMMDRAGIECDNCGKCISHCGAGALGYHLPRKGGRGPVKGGMVLLLLLLAAPLASGHHILGIPHYAYDEQYPQTPVLTYRVNAGPHEVKMTGYPGIPKPGEACSYHVYIKRLDTESPFDDRVTLEVFRDKLIGEDPVIYGPVEAKLEQSVYKFYPRFEAEANYTVRIRYEAEGAPWIIDLPVVVGEPGSPWTVLGSAVLGIAAFLVIIRAARIKMRRRAEGLAMGGAA